MVVLVTNHDYSVRMHGDSFPDLNFAETFLLSFLCLLSSVLGGKSCPVLQEMASRGVSLVYQMCDLLLLTTMPHLLQWQAFY